MSQQQWVAQVQTGPGEPVHALPTLQMHTQPSHHSPHHDPAETEGPPGGQWHTLLSDTCRRVTNFPQVLFCCLGFFFFFGILMEWFGFKETFKGHLSLVQSGWIKLL